MNLTKISIIAVTLFSSGCALSPMPENNYHFFSNFWGTLSACYDKGQVSIQKFNLSADSFSYALSTWSYDSEQLSLMAIDAYNRANTTSKNCSSQIAIADDLIANVKMRKANDAANMQHYLALTEMLNNIGISYDQATQDLLQSVDQQNSNNINGTAWNQKKRPPLFEYQYNYRNNLPGLQLFERSSQSASGRVTCIYNRGATLILPYGELICPQTYEYK
ncbi:hypothetical protein [Pseudidiomarina mangrovi]|uniref:hypothetical protein n=1 Tax=Pseudidiomarina mangrovi TaxID=2487133 RepID=UPI000FCB2FF8|nr:hypothetical protein [Pseudidiomarina mangrovi]